MKFYKTTYRIDEVGIDGKYKLTKPQWHTSGAEASAFRTAKKKEFKAADPVTIEVEIEASKPGILAFLNSGAAH